MESHLPTRPSSDLHRRFSSRARMASAMDRQHHISPGASGRSRQRSSSFSGISQSLSRLMPRNRPERGGTARPTDNASETGDILSPSKSVIQILSESGRSDERKDDGAEMRRTKSLSPKKISIFDNEQGFKGHRTNKPKKPSTLQRLWELHKGGKLDEGAVDISQRYDRLRSGVPQPHRSKQTDLHVSTTERKVVSCDPVPVTNNVQESITALRRSRQLFEEKKARREEQRSFRRSDDFIGVQGVNPRTGYPDPSSGTSTSAEDALSQSTKMRLDEDEKRMATASREYKAALERREKEIKRLELEMERRRMEKKERAEKKRAQLRAKIRKGGRWKNDGNAWSMVTEPGLSPILQSTAGTPTLESAPQPILPLTKVESAVRQSGRTPDDLNIKTSPPKTPQKHYGPKIGSTTHIQRMQKTRTFRAESTSKRAQQDCINSHPDAENADHRSDLTRPFVLPILQKEVGSPIACREVSSSETVIHTETAQPTPVELTANPGLTVAAAPPSITPTFKVTTPGETTHVMSLVSPASSNMPFLDFLREASPNMELLGNKAIATSYQLSSISQAQTHLPLLQTPKDMFQDIRITALEDFPPVVLKDPISAGIPPKLHGHQTLPPSPTWMKALKLPPQDRLRQVSSTTIPITITTGLEGLTCLVNQIDGSRDASEDQVSHRDQPVTNMRIPTPNFHVKETLNGMPNFGSQVNQADIATLLAHHPPALSTPTKRHIPRLCQKASSQEENIAGPKSTSTSTFMSPQRQSPPQQSAKAKNASQAVFLKTSTQHFCNEVKVRSASLVSPRRGTRQVAERLHQENTTLSGGNVGIGDHSKTLEELDRNPQLLRERIEYTKQLGGPPGNYGKDGFIVWCTETKRRVRFEGKVVEGDQEILHRLPMKRLQSTLGSPRRNARGPNKSARAIGLLRKAYEFAIDAAGTAWSFVLPVFNPRSKLRSRWLRNELTWRDMILIGAAGVFGGGAFLIMVLLARLLGVGMQIVKGCVKVCRVLAEL